jgi:hypothetical protein
MDQQASGGPARDRSGIGQGARPGSVGIIDAMLRWSLRRGDSVRTALEGGDAELRDIERSDVPFLLMLGRRAA